MGVIEGIRIVIFLLLLYLGYKMAQKKGMGGVGGVIMVMLFNWLGLIVIFFSARAEKPDPDQTKYEKDYRDTYYFIGLLFLVLILFVAIVYFSNKAP